MREESFTTQQFAKSFEMYFHLLLPYEPIWLKGKYELQNVPTKRLMLGNYPTPLQPFKFSWKEETFQMWIKRDDLTDMLGSGNKIRKLEFILPEVLEGRHDAILSLGPCQSNSCRVVTVVAPRLGLKSAHVLVKTKKEDGMDFKEGNMLFHNLFGSKLTFVTREEYREKGQEKLLEEAKQKLIKENVSINPFILPMGGSSLNGVFGYVEAFREIEEQISSLKIEINEIAFPCGSGSTAAGLAVGKFLSKGLRNVKLTGYVSWDSAGVNQFYEYVDDILEKLGLKEKASAEELVEFVEAHGTGYGLLTKEELGFLRDVARSSGILLDPTYEVKALKSFIESGKGRDSKCLFLHTGGPFPLMGRMEYVEDNSEFLF